MRTPRKRLRALEVDTGSRRAVRRVMSLPQSDLLEEIVEKARENPNQARSLRSQSHSKQTFLKGAQTSGLTSSQLRGLKVKRLKELLILDSLSTWGTKNVLLMRLKQHYMSLKVTELKKRLEPYTKDTSGGKDELALRLIRAVALLPLLEDSKLVLDANRPPAIGTTSTFPFPSTKSNLIFDTTLQEEATQNPFFIEYSSYRMEGLPALDWRNHDRNVEHWNHDHIKACRVVPMSGIPLQRILPSQFFHLTDVEQKYVDDIGRPTLEELENPKMKIDLKNNVFDDAIQSLSLAVGGGSMHRLQGQALLAGMTDPIFELLAETYKISLFTESVKTMKMNKKKERSFVFGGVTWSVPLNREVCLNGEERNIEEEVPVASFISKCSTPYTEGTGSSRPPSRRGSSNDVLDASSMPKILEGPSPKYYGEEIGTMLSQVAANVKQYGMQDQEAYALCLAFTRLHISVAFFPQELLLAATTGTSSVLPMDQYVYLIQSEEYELGTQEGRREATKALFALTKFWLSGQAKVACLNRVMLSTRN
ncbi:hypothetical protein BT69DRAFT_1356009 [Atractiella rhizophila]|nr:hypothetical protein BT69DRAFT_1356009 [Atractiella rhizophila]